MCGRMSQFCNEKLEYTYNVCINPMIPKLLAMTFNAQG